MAEHSHDHEPYRGEFPSVKDEAADSPRWLPALGFALLCLFGLFVAYRAANAHDEDAANVRGAETEADAVEADAVEAAAAPAEAGEGEAAKPVAE